MDEYRLEQPQRAILVGLFQGMRDEYAIEDSMHELKALAEAADASVEGSVVQNKQTIDVATFIGSGKVEEVKQWVEVTDADLVIFNDELSGSQIRNLEQMIGVSVIDRTILILDIFARRAESKIAKLQVELAQLKYRLPRLVGMGASLSRTGGGIGTRGPGEQKLELDRRRIQRRIDDINGQIQAAEKHRVVQKQMRGKKEVPVVALVGYTNAGKSSLMNAFIAHYDTGGADKQVFEKDMLFATLDTFTRRITLADKSTFVLTDTVGFVSKLPHSLISAFKSTLEEVLDADLLLHVIDGSSPHHEMQMQVTQGVLRELGADHIPIVEVFNKIDLDCIVDQNLHAGCYISAKQGLFLDTVRDAIKTHIFAQRRRCVFLIPYTEGRVTAYLCSMYSPERMAYEEEGVLLTVEVEDADYQRYRAYCKEDLQNDRQ